MKEYWVKIKDWHTQLEQRERRAVNIGGVAMIFAIFYLGIWSPFLGRVDDLRERITSDQKTLAWMQNADQQLSRQTQSGETKQNYSPVGMLAALQTEVQKAKMKDAMTELKQASNDSIQMHFKNVSFDQLMKLLMSVMRSSHATITQLSTTSESTPGMVNADITLTLG
jgi:type II secretory pathway component PulM